MPILLAVALLVPGTLPVDVGGSSRAAEPGLSRTLPTALGADRVASPDPGSPGPSCPYGAAGPAGAGACHNAPTVSRPSKGPSIGSLDVAGWLNLSPANASPNVGDFQLVEDGPHDPVALVCLSECPGEVWAFSNGTWTSHAGGGSGGPVPPQATEASIAYDPVAGYAVLFGGFASGPLGATWMLRNGTWTDISSWSSQRPAARFGAALAYDSTMRSLLLYGGLGANNTALNDTWSFAGGNWTRLDPAGTPPAGGGTAANDPADGGIVLAWTTGGIGPASTWTFARDRWTRSATTQEPPYSDPIVYDPWYGVPVLFAPAASGELSVWEYELGAWSLAPIAGNPVGPILAWSVAFDPPENRCVVALVPFHNDSLLNPPSSTWAFGSAEVSVAPDPSNGGWIGVGTDVVDTPTVLEIGLGGHALFELPAEGAIFLDWIASGNVSLLPSFGGAPTITVRGNGSLVADFLFEPEIELATDPAGCGPIRIDGIGHPTPGTVLLAVGTHAIAAPSCPSNLTFDGWIAEFGTSVAAPSLALSTLTVSGNGSLTAVFVAELRVSIVPASAGAVEIGRSTYGNGTIAGLPPGNYSIAPRPAAWAAFVGMSAGGSVELGPSAIAIAGPGTLSLAFRDVPEIAIVVDPARCGPVSAGGAEFPNGSLLPLGGRGAAPEPATLLAPSCEGAFERFERWVGSPNVSVEEPASFLTLVTARGNGTISAVYERVYVIATEVGPPGAAVMTVNGSPVVSTGTIELPIGTYALGLLPAQDGSAPRGTWAAGGALRLAGTSLTVLGNGSLTWTASPAPSGASLGAGLGAGSLLLAGLGTAAVASSAALAYAFGTRRRRRRPPT